MDYEVFEETPDCWAFRGPGVYQPFDPELPGSVPMTRERAEEALLQYRALAEGTD